MRRPNGRHELIAVHADRRESDLAAVPKETLALWQSTGKAGSRRAAPGEAGEKPYSMWWYVLVALLVAAVAESIFAGKYLNRRAGSSRLRGSRRHKEDDGESTRTGQQLSADPGVAVCVGALSHEGQRSPRSRR